MTDDTFTSRTAPPPRATIHDAGLPGAHLDLGGPAERGAGAGRVRTTSCCRLRAAPSSPRSDHSVEAVASELRGWREAIDDHGRGYDELVLWFEHDLFDQLNLIQVLDASTSPGPWPRPVTLICIGSFPGRPRSWGSASSPPASWSRSSNAASRSTPRSYALARAGMGRVPLDRSDGYRGAARDRHVGAAVSRRGAGAPSRGVPVDAATDCRAPSGACSALAACRADRPASRPFPRMHDEETAFYIADLSFAAHRARASASELAAARDRDRTARRAAMLAGHRRD